MTRVEAHLDALTPLLSRYRLEPVAVAPGDTIPGSYWGESEAGLIGNRIYFRADTPLHSVLHEACHFICMDDARRELLERDAGGDFDEENAVCYLQILLANEFEGTSSIQMCRDMDAWGYTFRLGSAQVWFEQDADDARRWLLAHRIIDEGGRLTGTCRSP
ncbi:MAG TPA: hypothetical protein VJ299_08010 [Steroidobacteraceae bacterium]|nr:hypothetical protein [Steroidobacteraceae bacterium]